MPTYDYQCANCGHKFEKFQSMSSPPVKKCPQCGENTVKRLIGIGAGVIFKGGGFYETDYRSDKYKADAKKETGGGESKAEGGDKGKSEGKADAKPEQKTPETKAAAAEPAPAKSNGGAEVKASKD